MPVTCGHRDKKGAYCIWGKQGAHYYYTPGDKASKERARKKAAKQGAAARASGYKGKAVDGTIVKASGIQSLRFDKKVFNRSEAVQWAKGHDFKSGNVEEMPNEWRLRQFPPGNCLRSGGMKDIDDGVRGYICPIKAKKSEDIEENDEKSNKIEVKMDKNDQKTPENELKSAENLQNDLKMKKNEQKLTKIDENDEKISKYEPPEDKNDLNEGHFVRFKNKIGLIVKVIE